jgi:hypothetical protein
LTLEVWIYAKVIALFDVSGVFLGGILFFIRQRSPGYDPQCNSIFIRKGRKI